MQNLPLPEEYVHQPTVDLLHCAYPHGIPLAHYETLLSILITDMSIRVLSAVIAAVRGGRYTTYMGEVGDAMRYKADPRVRETVLAKLHQCGYVENVE